jgi:hypothetical protein
MVAPTYPNVPIALGVPPVARNPETTPGTGDPKLIRDADEIDQLSSAQWGIYDQAGSNVLDPDNIASIGYSGEYRISDYPIEQGQFETYNKVATPFQSRVSMSKGGKLSDRQGFLARIEQIRGDTKLYNVVTPERVYMDVNIERVTLDRTAAAGAGLLTVEIGLREIRQTTSPSFTSSQTPSGADIVNNGAVQTKPSPQAVDQIK